MSVCGGGGGHRSVRVCGVVWYICKCSADGLMHVRNMKMSLHLHQFGQLHERTSSHVPW